MPNALKPIPKTESERVRALRNRERHVPFSDPADFKRRKRLEKDPAKWLRYYLGERFPVLFGGIHIELINACLRSIVNGTGVTAACPRGFGKTSIEWGVALYCVLTGECRFPVVIGWKNSAGVELLDQWLTQLSTNERLLEDYPCQCAPFAMSTQSTRLKGLIRDVETEESVGCDVSRMKCYVVIPSVKEPTTGVERKACVLASASINGSVKGMNVGLKTGESLRPDVALLDDPQDEETAQSSVGVAKVIKKINYGIRSLSGPRRRISVMAAVTCVEHEDVSHYLLTRPGTEIVKTSQITHWPEGWADEDGREGQTRKMWDEWNRVRIEGIEAKDEGKAARAFYSANKKALTLGMAVSWEQRFNPDSDPDALYAAMWDFYDLGEAAFMAERQNEPLIEGTSALEITPKMICSRIDHTRRSGQVPDWATLVIASTDVNPSYALSTSIIAFGNDQRHAVVWYGVHKMNVSGDLPDTQRKAEIMAGLEAHRKNILALPCRPSSWVIDGGGSPENTIITFAAHCEIETFTAFGRSSTQYRTYGRSKQRIKPFEQAHIVSESYSRKWIIWNADFWRKQSHLAWVGAIGSPGTCDLPPGNHGDFAEQICNEQLRGEVELNGKTIYDWKTKPGPHDFGDVMAQGLMFAAVRGIGTGGGLPQKKKKKAAAIVGGKLIGG